MNSDAETIELFMVNDDLFLRLLKETGQRLTNKALSILCKDYVSELSDGTRDLSQVDWMKIAKGINGRWQRNDN